MNERDIELIKERKAKLKAELKEEQRKHKDDRNQGKINDIMYRINQISGWLGQATDKKGHAKSAPKAKMTKAEFKEKFKREARMGAPEHTMLITSVDMLRNVWPLVIGQNIQLSYPPEMSEEDIKALREEARRLHEEHKHKLRKDGFR